MKLAGPPVYSSPRQYVSLHDAVNIATMTSAIGISAVENKSGIHRGPFACPVDFPAPSIDVL